jgi:hypothetical protein
MKGKKGGVKRTFYGKIMKTYEGIDNAFVVRFTAIADDIKKNLREMALTQGF